MQEKLKMNSEKGPEVCDIVKKKPGKNTILFAWIVLKVNRKNGILPRFFAQNYLFVTFNIDFEQLFAQITIMRSYYFWGPTNFF